ncbi:MAG: hypothetical protein ACYS99_05155 [Planctomycetota bacterium]
MRELASRFVAAADEVYRLQTAKDAEGALFRRIAAQGHFGKRRLTRSTRQGIYALTPGGELLASTNSTSAKTVAKTLEKALAKWEEQSRRHRAWVRAEGIGTTETTHPGGGLVLQVATRDLPRSRSEDWNLDFAWFRKEEARDFLPRTPVRGAVRKVPQSLVRRIARCHLLDSVHGQTWPYQDRHVLLARLSSRVVAVDGRTIRVHLTGRSRTRARGMWRVDGFLSPERWQERGYDAMLAGKAVFDRASGRFTAFELLAVGKRWGATQYNGRSRDRGPAPMGVLFTLAGDSAAERVPPAFLESYGW